MKEIINETLLHACYFKSGDLIHTSVRVTKKASICEAIRVMKVGDWNAAKSQGVRCAEVVISRLRE